MSRIMKVFQLRQLGSPEEAGQVGPLSYILRAAGSHRRSEQRRLEDMSPSGRAALKALCKRSRVEKGGCAGRRGAQNSAT